MFLKSSRKLLWLDSFDIFVVALQKHFVHDESLKVMILVQHWPETAKSSWHCSFKHLPQVFQLCSSQSMWIFPIPSLPCFVLLLLFWCCLPLLTTVLKFVRVERDHNRGAGGIHSAVVRAPAFHQFGPGVICGLSLLLVLYSALRGFSPSTPNSPSPQKPTFPNSESILECTDILNEFL